MKHKIWLMAVLILATPAAFSDIDHMYGFGSTTAAQAGANEARSYDAYTVQLNPALMSLTPGSHMSMGLFGVVDKFDDLHNVVIDNPYVGGSSVRKGDVDTSVPATFDILFGAVWSLTEDARAWRFGIGLGFPGDKLMEPTTKDIYQPEYAMYMSDTQRFAANFALSRKLGDYFAVGVGLSYHLQTGATVQARLPQDGGAGNPKTTTGNLKMLVKPNLSPMLGFTYMPDEFETWALSYKAARDAKVDTKFDSTIELLGSAPLILNAGGSIFYDPETFSLAYSRRFANWDWNMAVDYERWQPFDGSIVHFSFDTFSGSFKQYSSQTAYHDIWIPHIGASIPCGATSAVQFGYAYRPSPTPNLQGESNFLDSDRHVLGVGFDFQTGSFGMMTTPLKWSTHVQGHYLNPRDVKKDNATDIGAPGYEVKGFVISYGANLTVDL